MKTETKIKKLALKKETLRDLTAHNAGEIRAGGKGGNTKNCTNKCPFTRMSGLCTGCTV